MNSNNKYELLELSNTTLRSQCCECKCPNAQVYCCQEYFVAEECIHRPAGREYKYWDKRCLTRDQNLAGTWVGDILGLKYYAASRVDKPSESSSTFVSCDTTCFYYQGEFWREWTEDGSLGDSNRERLLLSFKYSGCTPRYLSWTQDPIETPQTFKDLFRDNNTLVKNPAAKETGDNEYVWRTYTNYGEALRGWKKFLKHKIFTPLGIYDTGLRNNTNYEEHMRSIPNSHIPHQDMVKSGDAEALEWGGPMRDDDTGYSYSFHNGGSSKFQQSGNKTPTGPSKTTVSLRRFVAFRVVSRVAVI